MSNKVHLLGRLVITILSALVLVNCGGGGVASTPSADAATTPALPTLVQDFLPTGTRLAAPVNLFPLSVGDTATYRKLGAFGVQLGTVTRSLAPSPRGGAALTLTNIDTTKPTGIVQLDYSKTSAGVFAHVQTDNSLPKAAATLIGALLDYAEPLYAIGEVRTSIRQGPWGADADGDGIQDSFRLTYSQIFRGFETIAFGSKTVSVAHFSNVTTLTLQPSRTNLASASIIQTEEAHFAGGFGLVRVVVEGKDGQGQITTPRYTLEIDSATINGKSWADFISPIDGKTITVNLAHKALVADTLRNVYYAAIPANSASNANTIATINANTGAVSYSTALAAEPGAMAISADGALLYVYNANQVIRFALPSLLETGRFTLPLSTTFGVALPTVAQSISVSPLNSNLVAVSFGQTPNVNHEAVAIYNNLALQPLMTQPFPRNNLVTFAVDGSEILGLDMETSGIELGRITLLGNGLTQSIGAVVSTAPKIGYGRLSLDVSQNYIVIGESIRAYSDFALLGSLPGQECRLTPTVALCFEKTPGYLSDTNERIVVIDPVTRLVTDYLRYGTDDLSPASSTLYYTKRMTLGASGKVAISAIQALAGEYTKLQLFSSPKLP